ncbi:VanZ family protein [Actinoplanes sp. NPDC051861]|uniref:VanZ family protein n=1 Tax=Actinoplanes sp. NPDC051861 TaxID=3155170 RepID=UPI003440C466
MTHQITIPALPILLPLGVFLMAVSGAVLHRRGLMTRARLGMAWFASWWTVAVLGATMLPLPLSWGPGAGDPEPYRLILEPVLSARPADVILNTVMTLPMAALMYIMFGVREQRRVVLTGFLISLAIEVSQAVLVIQLHANRWPDVNDLMSNTLGALVGYLLFRRLMRYERFRRAVESCSFARTDRGTPVAVR